MADESPAPAPAPPPDEQPDRQAQPVDAEEGPRLPFPVVGIGASAGGLEAVSQFLDAMRPDGGMAFILVQHLPPDRESMMAEILARRTAMPVAQVEDGMAVEPDHVYVIRPGHVLTIRDGRLHLGPALGSPRAANRPVDDFFRSLAEEQRERAVCVVMSGMGSNGSAGAQAIKAVGGLCIAQDPESAQFPSMPKHLIDAGYADYVLAPADMPEVLLGYAKHPYVRGGREADAQPTLRREGDPFKEILALLRARTRQDFSGYKKPTMLRRIQRRMGLTRTETVAEYARLLRQMPAEAGALSDDLLIHVTGFFRDPQAWEALLRHVVVPLVESRESGGSVRAWVTACSSGEEAYSLAMVLLEEAERAGKELDVKIFATDLAERALAHARAGVYPGGIESDVAPARLERFFTRDDAIYRVRERLRDCVVFAPQNVLQDPPFSRLDIVSCRNLMIYLEPEVQQRVLALLHFGLLEGGALFMGGAETVTGAEDLFEPIDKRARIFRRIGKSRHGLADFPLPRALPPRGEGEGRPGPKPARAGAARPSVEQLTQRALLKGHTPPAVTVDREYRVHYYHGDTRPFLQQPHGEPTRDVMRLAREGVGGAVRVALHRAAAQADRVTVLDGWAEVEPGRRARIAVVVSPVGPDPGPDVKPGPPEYFVVSFEERGDFVAPAPEDPAAGGAESDDELRRLRAELQRTVEEVQTSNEGLRASNQEVMSINEEYQAANEELETSREEMQSLNEELTTVNAQLRAKVEEHLAASSDLASLLASTDIAVLFLDTAFRIRRYTPAVRDLVDLIATDVGRPLAALARRFTDPRLDDDARAVLERLVPVEREVTAADGRHYLRRVLPYRTTDNRIDGVVVTFVDISARKGAEEALRASEEQFRRAIEDAPIPVIMQAEDGRVLQVSRTWAELTGYALADVPTADAWLTLTYGPGADAVRAHMRELFGGDRKTLGVEFTIRTRAGGERHWSFSASAPGTLRDGRRFLVGMAVDVTDRRRAEEAQRAGEARLREMLNTPVVGVLTFAEDGTLLDANDAFLRMSGYGRDEVEGRALTWQRMTPPEHVAESERQLGLFARTGRVGPYEKEYLRKDGTRSWMLFAGAGLGDGTLVEFVIDVSDRKRAEQAARESEERFRLVVEAARGFAMFATDVGGRITAWNPAAEALLGWSEAEAVGQPGAMIFVPEDRAAGKHEQEMATAERDGRAPDERWHVKKDGSRFWGSGELTAAREPGGDLRGFVKILRDETARKQAEDRLRESEERLRVALSAAEMGTWLWRIREDEQILDASLRRLMGLPPDEEVKTLDGFLRAVRAEDRDLVRTEFERCRREGGNFTVEFRVTWPDGSQHWLQDQGKAFPGPDGRPEFIAGACVDITERKRAEEALARDAQVLASVRDSVIVTDLDGVITHWNEGATRLFGWAAEEMLGRPYADRFPAEARGWIEEQIRARAGGSEWSGEFEDWRKDGTRVWIDARVSRVHDAAGRPVALLGVAHDLSERKRMEAELRRANDELEARVRERTAALERSQERALQAERLAAIGQMIAGLAHESRNALQRSQACLSMLTYRLEGQPEALDLVNRAQQAQNDLHRLYEDVREYAAPIRFEPARCDVAQVWREAWDELGISRTGRDAELREEVEGAEPSCPGSPFHLKQVFRNVLDNALGAADDPVRIRIRCSDAQLEGRPVLRVEVHDNGPGFTPEQRLNAFEPFFTTKLHGTGLGLAICGRIIDAHGGRIDLGVTEGPGGCLIIQLPRGSHEH